ncbi:MAG: cytochrome c [Alphaproteobacteria bacterium]|nr:cytochrome c [Alphaproteobacteria bacterium]
MRSRSLLAGAVALVAGLGLSTPAQAFPWDIDMVDAQFFRAYEWAMMRLPEGAISTNRFVANHDRLTPEGVALTNPYDESKASVELGQKMFATYCQTCHGVEGKGGAPVMDNDPANGIKRYPVPAPMLSGPGAISTARSDGYIYLTIRNGGNVMPRYGTSMDDHEMWAIVRYLRTLEGAQYTPPQPAAATE